MGVHEYEIVPAWVDSPEGLLPQDVLYFYKVGTYITCSGDVLIVETLTAAPVDLTQDRIVWRATAANGSTYYIDITIERRSTIR